MTEATKVKELDYLIAAYSTLGISVKQINAFYNIENNNLRRSADRIETVMQIISKNPQNA